MDATMPQTLAQLPRYASGATSSCDRRPKPPCFTMHPLCLLPLLVSDHAPNASLKAGSNGGVMVLKQLANVLPRRRACEVHDALVGAVAGEGVGGLLVVHRANDGEQLLVPPHTLLHMDLDSVRVPDVAPQQLKPASGHREGVARVVAGGLPPGRRRSRWSLRGTRARSRG